MKSIGISQNSGIVVDSNNIIDAFGNETIIDFVANDVIPPTVKLNEIDAVNNEIYYFNSAVEIILSDDFAGVNFTRLEVGNESKAPNLEETTVVYTVYD